MNNTEINIGRATDNDIIFTNNYVSRQHALIVFKNGEWAVKDKGSMSGIFLNGKRIQFSQMKLGDVLYIIGIRIIPGTNFIAISGKPDELTINENKLQIVTADCVDLLFPQLQKTDRKTELFNRAPRFRNALSSDEIEIESPPMSINGNQIPMFLRMGRPMIYGASAAMSGNIMSLITMMMFPLMTSRYTDNQKKEYEKKRTEKYTLYLHEKKLEIQNEKRREETILNINYPSLNSILSYSNDKNKLWNRRKTDDDFMCVRIGFGKLPLQIALSYPEQRFNLDDDPLETAMYQLAETPVSLENVPILVDLKEHASVGIHGPKRMKKEFILNIILRMAVLYSYDEMKMVMLADEKDLREMDFIKSVPHFWDDQRSIRFIASDASEAYIIGEYFRKHLEFDRDKKQELKEILKKQPYYVVFAMNKKLFDCLEILKEVLQQETNCGLSVINVYDDIPKETSLLITLDPSGTHSIIHLKELEMEKNTFAFDPLDYRKALPVFSKISNTYLNIFLEEYSLPKALTFLEMFSVGKVEHLNITSRWKKSNSVGSLAAPVGVGTDGALFLLDLHQKYQGPHGLVAGMTGSGKSEFLITYILSMAITYHPDDVAFVLIDYKGGGLAGAFDDPLRGIHLPHLVGTITNLDGASIQRAIISIESEMKRRQRVFNYAKSISAEGTMDIYTYQRLYKNHIVTEPLPHLFIISDEFAELKQQQPQFMDQLISIARIGRSLGVHLILATQKPSGVVNDQIRSNTKFQICLKVQSRSDSVDMLNRPDAVELKETGRFYLQVGYNEFFAMGQSAWTGAEYDPQDEVVVNKDDSIQFVDNVGQTILNVKPIVEKSNDKGTQLTAIVQHISDLAKEQGIPQRTLWLPPMKDKIDLSELDVDKKTGQVDETINVILGMIDDPANQKQYPLSIDFQTNGHTVVIGDQGCGKTTFIQSMLLKLSEKYDANDVNYYILDFSSNLLNVFDRLPQCGAVIDESNNEYVQQLFSFLENIVSERKQIFRKIEANNFETARSIRKMPLILVVIDNFPAALSGEKGEKVLRNLYVYLKEWLAYGIRFIVTVNHLNELSSRIKQEMQYRIPLRIDDLYEYREALNIRTEKMPAQNAGRGLIAAEEDAMEIQIGIFDAESEESIRIQHIKERIAELSTDKNDFAPRLPMVSTDENYEHFLRTFSRRGRIPLGYDRSNSNPVALPLKQFSTLTLFLGHERSRFQVIKNMLDAIQNENMKLFMIRKKTDSILDQPEYSLNIDGLMPEMEGIKSLALSLKDEVQNRLPILQEYCENHGIDIEQEDALPEIFDYMYHKCQPCMIFMEGFSDFCAYLEEKPDLRRFFIAILTLAKKCQIYLIGCVYPQEIPLYQNSPFKSYFNDGKMVILFGEHPENQEFVMVPESLVKESKMDIPNNCLMYYQEEFYMLRMPCGEMGDQEEFIDEDLQPIFRK